MKNLKMPTPAWLICCFILPSACCLHAQNTVFTYQGQVQSGGTNFTGMGQFQFALVTSTNYSSPATATAVMGGAAPYEFVENLTLVTGGSGYVTTPAVTISGGGGSGATAQATMAGGVVTGVSIMSPGSGYSGTPTVTIAPPPANIFYTTYWSNGGTVDGSEPATAVSVPVTNGLFTVVVGDPTLANMAAIPATLFNQTGLELRIWFNDGTDGFALLNPGQNLTPTPYATAAAYATVAGSVNNGLTVQVNSAGAPNLIGGAPVNYVASGVVGATIVGGGATNYQGIPDTNSVSADFGTIGGGYGNQVGLLASAATIGGGYANQILTYSSDATIGGGQYNQILAESFDATIGGGTGNQIQYNAPNSTIGGGTQNAIQPGAFTSTIGGGYDNQIQSNAYYATISGGEQNMIQPGAYNSTIGGGIYNQILTNAYTATIGGGAQNQIQTNANGSVIGGGIDNLILANAFNSTIGGGFANQIQTNAYSSTIGGGAQNTIQTNANYAAIGGGFENVIQSNSYSSTISGGYNNQIQPGANNSTIGGGYGNQIQTNASGSIIAGGTYNHIDPAAVYGTIAGGNANAVQANAYEATIGGGYQNYTFGPYATVPGGEYNVASAEYTFAAGQQAQAVHAGAFVWADAQNSVFSSAGINTFNIRASGGVYLDPSTPAINFGGSQGVTEQMLNLYGTGYGIGVQSNTEYYRTAGGFAWYKGGTHNNGQNNAGGGTTMMLLSSSGLTVNGTFVNSSDRNAKEDFAAVNPQAVLDKVAAMPITQWVYKTDTGTRHIGPMAQDFYAAFNVGPDERHITTVDEGGVALAAIQGLNAKVEEKEKRIQEQEARIQKQASEIGNLQEKLAALQAVVEQLAQKR